MSDSDSTSDGRLGQALAEACDVPPSPGRDGADLPVAPKRLPRRPRPKRVAEKVSKKIKLRLAKCVFLFSFHLLFVS